MILHSQQIDGHHIEFIEDLNLTLTSFLETAKSDHNLKAIFKTCTAAHCVFASFARNAGILLQAASGSIRRCSILSCIHQVSLVRVELRRLIECVLWHIYFVDHPVEFSEFLAHPDRGWGDDRSQTPIAAAAASEMGYFFRYAKERFKQAGVEEGLHCISNLHTEYGNLSMDVHAAVGAVHPSGTLALSFDRFDGGIASGLAKDIRAVASDAILATTALSPAYLSTCDVVERSWFDWLIGSIRAKLVRSKDFGLVR